MAKKNNNFKVVLETTGIKHKAEADSVNKALEKMEISWENVKAKGVITVSKGSKKYEHFFYLKQLKRIFANKYARLLWAKRLELLLSLQ